MPASATKDSVLVNEGVRLYRDGKKREARFVLEVAVEAGPGNELAWFWLAALARDPEEAVESLNEVLRLNPANDRARMWRDRFLSRVALSGLATGIVKLMRTRQFFPQAHGVGA